MPINDENKIGECESDHSHDKEENECFMRGKLFDRKSRGLMFTYNGLSFDNALDFYCSTGYCDINSHLLGYFPNCDEGEKKILDELIEEMNKLFQPAPYYIVVSPMNFMKIIKNVMSPHQRRRKSLKSFVLKMRFLIF